MSTDAAPAEPAAARTVTDVPPATGDGAPAGDLFPADDDRSPPGGAARVVVRWLLVLSLMVVVGGLIVGDLFLFGALRPSHQSTSDTPPPPAPSAVAVPGGSSGSTDLTGWAATIAASTGIPARAAQAYGQAQLTLAGSDPACRLSWNTLAGIATIESDNGQFDGAQLRADGTETKPIIGVPLDGSAGNRSVPATDHGALDGDPVHDHAVGPFQFLPATWLAYAPAGADPQNIDAAALAAGRYLCSGGHDLASGPDWWAAILAYNDSLSYARHVFAETNSYAAASRGA
jgi:hypothetical protein